MCDFFAKGAAYAAPFLIHKLYCNGGFKVGVKQAQLEVREAFAGGSIGQLISGLLWLASAALATWSTQRSAILLLVIGGMFIFPATQLALRLAGKAGKLSENNPLNSLGMQLAFVLPLSLPLVYAAAMYNPNWFYPSFTILVGAHYLPFVFLYGMPQFAILCGVLVSAVSHITTKSDE